MAEPVILLHGLWMRRPALWLLAGRLRAAGFEVDLFPYATLWARPEASVERLAQWVRDRAPGPVHLVGHSLGGVTALALLQQVSDLPPGRVVCLGAPIAGSGAAAAIESRRLSLLIGRSLPLLKRGVGIAQGREVGMIAGSRGSGAGKWIARLDAPHDGSVAVAETRLPGLADHLLLPVSHSGLMWSRAAAAATVRFLRDGRFDPVAVGA